MGEFTAFYTGKSVWCCYLTKKCYFHTLDNMSRNQGLNQNHIQSWIYIRETCWSWNPNTLATWCEELTHLKRPWCWERLKVGGEGDNRGWDGWMASLTWWTCVWVNAGSWWWTGRPGMLRFMGSQRVGHNWTTELTDWLTDYIISSWVFVVVLVVKKGL